MNTVFADSPQLNVRDPLPGVEISFPRPIIVDSELRIIDCTTSLRFRNPIICTCVLPGSDRWKEAAIKMEQINGTLINCKATGTGRLESLSGGYVLVCGDNLLLDFQIR